MMEDMLQFILDRGRELGAGYVEARHHRVEASEVMLKSGTPEASASSQSTGIGMRVLVDGAMAFGASNRNDRRSLEAVLARMVRSARGASERRTDPIEFADANLGIASYEIRPRVKFTDVEVADRQALLMEADRSAVEAIEGTGVKLPGRYMSLETEVTHKTVWTSDGARVRSTVPRASMFAVLTAAGPSGSTQRMISLGEARGWECVERWDLPSTLAKEASTLAAILEQGKPFHGGYMDVVLGPEVVGLIAHESSGHPGEADRVLGREAAQAGETYLGKNDGGRRVGSDLVNVVEDPTLPYSFGFYLFDDEGVAARPRNLIRDGVIEEFLHNRETARTFGVASNGSARSMAFDREPIVRMSNTFVEPGDHGLDEMLEDVKDGVYVRNFMEWNIDDRRFNQR